MLQAGVTAIGTVLFPEVAVVAGIGAALTPFVGDLVSEIGGPEWAKNLDVGNFVRSGISRYTGEVRAQGFFENVLANVLGLASVPVLGKVLAAAAPQIASRAAALANPAAQKVGAALGAGAAATGSNALGPGLAKSVGASAGLSAWEANKSNDMNPAIDAAAGLGASMLGGGAGGKAFKKLGKQGGNTPTNARLAAGETLNEGERHETDLFGGIDRIIADAKRSGVNLTDAQSVDRLGTMARDAREADRAKVSDEVRGQAKSFHDETKEAAESIAKRKEDVAGIRAGSSFDSGGEGKILEKAAAARKDMQSILDRHESLRKQHVEQEITKEALTEPRYNKNTGEWEPGESSGGKLLFRNADLSDAMVALEEFNKKYGNVGSMRGVYKQIAGDLSAKKTHPVAGLGERPLSKSGVTDERRTEVYNEAMSDALAKGESSADAERIANNAVSKLGWVDEHGEEVHSDSLAIPGIKALEIVKHKIDSGAYFEFGDRNLPETKAILQDVSAGIDNALKNAYPGYQRAMVAHAEIMEAMKSFTTKGMPGFESLDTNATVRTSDNDYKVGAEAIGSHFASSGEEGGRDARLFMDMLKSANADERDRLEAFMRSHIMSKVTSEDGRSIDEEKLAIYLKSHRAALNNLPIAPTRNPQENQTMYAALKKKGEAIDLVNAELMKGESLHQDAVKKLENIDKDVDQQYSGKYGEGVLEVFDAKKERDVPEVVKGIIDSPLRMRQLKERFEGDQGKMSTIRGAILSTLMEQPAAGNQFRSKSAGPYDPSLQASALRKAFGLRTAKGDSRSPLRDSGIFSKEHIDALLGDGSHNKEGIIGAMENLWGAHSKRLVMSGNNLQSIINDDAIMRSIKHIASVSLHARFAFAIKEMLASRNKAAVEAAHEEIVKAIANPTYAQELMKLYSDRFSSDAETIRLRTRIAKRVASVIVGSGQHLIRAGSGGAFTPTKGPGDESSSN